MAISLCRTLTSRTSWTCVNLYSVILLVVLYGVTKLDLQFGLWPREDPVCRAGNGLSPYNVSGSSSDIEEDFRTCHNSNVFSLLGATKQQQYRRFRDVAAPYFRYKKRKMLIDKRKNQMKQFQTPNPPRWDVQIQELKGYVLVTVQEVYGNLTHNVSSRGGSSLFGIVGTKCNKTLCAYKDYFDGRYTVLCPLFSPKVHIKITVLTIDFEQFRGFLKTVDKVILDREFTSSNNPLQVSTQVTMKWSCRSPDNTALCKTLGGYDRVYMVGASHMRYQFFHAIKVCGKHVPDIKRRLYHVDASYGLDLVDALNAMVDDSTPDDCSATSFHSNILSYEKISKRFHFAVRKTDNFQMFVYRKCLVKGNPEDIDLKSSNDTDTKMRFCFSDRRKRVAILAQTGSWDLANIGIESSLSKTIPAIDAALKRFSKVHGAKQHVRFLFMSPPPFNPRDFLIGRSNDEIQLYSSALGAVAKKHTGIGYFSTFNAIFPAFRDNVDTHYMSCHARKAECRGTHGKIVFQDAIKALANMKK